MKECKNYGRKLYDEDHLVFLVNGNGGIVLIKPTDNCFVLCSDHNCFAEHQLVLRAEKVHVCVKVQNLGLVNWD